MLGYTLKPVLEIVPEAHSLVKSASVDVDWPLDSRDSACASALCAQYLMLTKSAGVDADTLDRINTAVMAYGATGDVAQASRELGQRLALGRMEKSAAEGLAGNYAVAMNGFEDAGTGFKTVEGMVKAASEVRDAADRAGITSVPFDVDRYLGNAALSKSAAVSALNLRHYLTGNEAFEKLAGAIEALPEASLPAPGSDTLKTLCETVSGLDKTAGLQARGLDFYKEALIEKSAAAAGLCAKVGGEMVPVSKIQRIPKDHVAHYIDKDLAEELATGDPHSLKAAVEALPMDSHNVLKNLLKHV